MENQSASKTLVASVLLSFVAGIMGTVLAEHYLFGKNVLAQNFSPPVQTQQVQREKTTYIEESQSIDAIKKVGPSVVSIVASKDLKIYKNNPFSLGSGDPFGNFPGFYFNSRGQQDSQDSQDVKGDLQDVLR